MSDKAGADAPEPCPVRVVREVSAAEPTPDTPDLPHHEAIGDPNAPVNTVQCLFTTVHALTFTVHGDTPEEIAAIAVREAGQMSGWKALDETGPIWVDRIVRGDHDSAYTEGAQALPVPHAFGEAATAAHAVALTMGATLFRVLDLLEQLRDGRVVRTTTVLEGIDLIERTVGAYGIDRPAVGENSAVETVPPTLLSRPIEFSPASSASDGAAVLTAPMSAPMTRARALEIVTAAAIAASAARADIDRGGGQSCVSASLSVVDRLQVAEAILCLNQP